MLENELQACRILVTRPGEQAKALISMIDQAGGIAVACPAIEILPSPITVEALRLVLGQADIVVFISSNAVRESAILLQTNQLMFPVTAQLACVGPASAEAVQACYQRDVDILPSCQFDSEGLLATSEMQDVAGKRVLIFRGKGGRELLGDSLLARGARVEYVEVYCRQAANLLPEQRSAIIEGGIDLITATSGEILQNLVAMFADDADWLFALPLLVVNNRQVEIARQLGFNNEILIAGQASDVAMFKAIRQFARQDI